MSAVDIVVITALGIGGLYSGAKKRSQMKKEDEEIKQEASRERNMEFEKPNLPDKEHPLKDGTSSVILVRGEFGTDDGLPETVDTFAHRGHGSVKKLDGKLDIFHCSHCTNIGKGLRYRCEFEGCDPVHPICAKSPTRIHSFMHPEHELVLATRPFFATCAVCNRGRKSNINNRVYACKDCKFYLHPTCSLWPRYLFNELHSKPHPLQLININVSSSSSSSTCHGCKKKCNGSVLYRCQSCQENYHPLCLLRFSLNEKADGKLGNAFKKEVAEKSGFHVEFVGIDHLGLIG